MPLQLLLLLLLLLLPLPLQRLKTHHYFGPLLLVVLQHRNEGNTAEHAQETDGAESWWTA